MSADANGFIPNFVLRVHIISKLGLPILLSESVIINTVPRGWYLIVPLI